MAKIVMAGLESYRGTDKAIDQVLSRKADIMKIVESFTGDGNFKVKLDKNPATMRLDVRATGKSLSEVVPAGAIVPIAGAALLGLRQGRAMSSPPMPAPPAPAGGNKPAPTPKPPAPAPKK